MNANLLPVRRWLTGLIARLHTKSILIVDADIEEALVVVVDFTWAPPALNKGVEATGARSHS